MKRLLCLLLLLSSLCFSQGFNAHQTVIFSGTGSGTSVRELGGSLFHQLIWTKSGTVSTCTVALDSSADGISWSAGGIITGQTCTSNGQSALTSGSANYVRITLTVFSGGGTLTVTYNGYASSGGSTGTVTNVATGSGLTGGPVTTTGTVSLLDALQRTTGQSIVSVNLGQNAGNQNWTYNSFYVVPTVTTSGTGAGGNFVAGHTASVRIAFNTAAGLTIPGPMATGANCAAGGGCTVTVTAPTLPTGYTGYTVYDCDTTDSGASCIGGLTPAFSNVKQQAASPNCVNITTNCVIVTAAAGSAAPTISTAWVQPPNTQAQECPPSVIPSEFVQTNDGNWHTYAGMSTNTANGNTGVKTICQQTFFTDLAHSNSGFSPSLSDPISYNNAMIAFNHSHAELSQTNQNRMLAGASFTPVGFAGTLWGAELMQFEMDKNCNGCTLNGSPDGEFTLASFQLQDNSVTNTSSSFGTDVMRLSFFKSGNGQDTGGMNIINSNFQFNNTSTMGTAGIYKGTCTGSGTFNSGCVNSWWVNNASLTLQGVGQVALYSSGNPGGGDNGVNMFLRNDSVGIRSLINGSTILSGLVNNAVATFPVTGSVVVTPSITTAQAATLSNPTSVSCTGGASTYSYALVGVDNNGGHTAVSGNSSCTTGTNPLTVGNPATIGFTAVNFPRSITDQFTSIDIYRTAGPMATGKIGSLACPAAAGASVALCQTFTDTGLAAGAAAPTTNTTGSINSFTYQTNTNCAATGTAANPSVSTCGSAAAGVFSCDVAASAGTCKVNTTAVTANSIIIVHESADAADATRIGGGITCNAAPTVFPGILLNARVAGTSFTINAPTFTVNPTCFEYYIIN